MLSANLLNLPDFSKHFPTQFHPSHVSIRNKLTNRKQPLLQLSVAGVNISIWGIILALFLQWRWGLAAATYAAGGAAAGLYLCLLHFRFLGLGCLLLFVAALLAAAL